MKIEAVRAAIFVFVLLAIAEVVAPYFKINFHDPLLLTAFVSGVLGHVINPRGSGNRHSLLIVRESDLCDTVKKIGGIAGNFAEIHVADSSDQAAEIVAKINPGKTGVLDRVHGLIETALTKQS